MKITSSLTTDATASTGPKNALTGTTDEFLKLFMAQLQHQDPLDPTSGADMVAQLAQMTAVEQTRQTNQQLSDLVAAQASQASAGLTNLIGHEVNGAAGTFAYDPAKGPVPPLEVTSGRPMQGASIVITDATGKEIRRVPIADGLTNTTFQWDGTDAAGNRVGAGNYAITVDGGTSAGNITSQWHGRVDAVELTVDGPRLRIGGLLVAPATIATIGGLAALANYTSSQGV